MNQRPRVHCLTNKVAALGIAFQQSIPLQKAANAVRDGTPNGRLGDGLAASIRRLVDDYNPKIFQIRGQANF